jgi:outer membrane murein-binding lipoprotein Lpp
MTWEHALEAHVRENARQFDAVEAGFADLHQLMLTEFGEVRARLDHLTVDVLGLKVDVGTVKADITRLQTDVSALRADVAQLEARMDALSAEMQAGFQSNNRRFDRLDAQLDLLVRGLLKAPPPH